MPIIGASTIGVGLLLSAAGAISGSAKATIIDLIVGLLLIATGVWLGWPWRKFRQGQAARGGSR